MEIKDNEYMLRHFVYETHEISMKTFIFRSTNYKSLAIKFRPVWIKQLPPPAGKAEKEPSSNNRVLPELDSWLRACLRQLLF